MICFRLILCLVCVSPMFGMQVNMEGSLRLGRDVVDTINHYMIRSLYSRRSERGLAGPNAKDIESIVNSASLCRNIDFCKDHQIFNEYIIALARVIENILQGLVEKSNKEYDTKSVLFEEELKVLLQDVKKLLKDYDDESADVYNWLDLIKKISEKFREKALAFASQGLEGSPDEVNKVKTMLTQKLTIALTGIELEYEHRFCTDHEICTTNFECTKALDTLLEKINNMPDDRAKEFVRLFSDALPDTGFYNLISDVTSHEFQSILNDMAYSENVPTKNVLSIVHKNVKERVDFVEKRNVDITGGADVKLLHVIISDLDHIYDKENEPFYYFLKSFNEWSDKGSGRFSVPLRKVMSDILKKLSSHSEHLISKMKNEIKVFLEITVDPV